MSRFSLSSFECCLPEYSTSRFSVICPVIPFPAHNLLLFVSWLLVELPVVILFLQLDLTSSSFSFFSSRNMFFCRPRFCYFPYPWWVSFKPYIRDSGRFKSTRSPSEGRHSSHVSGFWPAISNNISEKSCGFKKLNSPECPISCHPTIQGSFSLFSYSASSLSCLDLVFFQQSSSTPPLTQSFSSWWYPAPLLSLTFHYPQFLWNPSVLAGNFYPWVASSVPIFSDGPKDLLPGFWSIYRKNLPWKGNLFSEIHKIPFGRSSLRCTDVPGPWPVLI